MLLYSRDTFIISISGCQNKRKIWYAKMPIKENERIVLSLPLTQTLNKL